MESEVLVVGDTLYRFDCNRRVYDRTVTGGAPIYSEHFVAEKIIGETKGCWLTAGNYRPAKVNKKTLTVAADRWGKISYFTRAGMEDQIWLHAHKHRIVRLVETSAAKKLREIAAIIGYEPPLGNA